jgi:hypothetical protein
MEGWIKLHRKILKWEWFTTPNMFHLFSYLLLSANFEDKEWQGRIIKRGQIVIGRDTLSANTGISVQSIRTCIERLKSTNEITIKSTNKFSIITICKYEDYQIIEDRTNQQINQPANQQLTNNQPTTNHILRSKEEKEKKKRNPPNKSGRDFIDRILNIFSSEYEGYVILNRDKERKAIGVLLKYYKKSFPDSTSAETLQDLRDFFKVCINIKDNWLRTHMSPSIIVSKFNEINKIVNNGTPKPKGATNEEIFRAVAKHFAVDYKLSDTKHSQN